MDSHGIVPGKKNLEMLLQDWMCFGLAIKVWITPYHPYSSLFILIHPYSSLFILIHPYSSLFILIHPYSSLFQISLVKINISNPCISKSRDDQKLNLWQSMVDTAGASQRLGMDWLTLKKPKIPRVSWLSGNFSGEVQCSFWCFINVYPCWFTRCLICCLPMSHFFDHVGWSPIRRKKHPVRVFALP